ncbi:MAG: hypothetical protein E6R03_10540, partial [Hyphomicrobiaceae bacterium]
MPINLTKLYQPEYDRLLATIRRVGLAVDQWSGPEFKARRNRSGGNTRARLAGKANLCQVVVYIRPCRTLADIYETMAHELAHVLTWEEAEDHGPAFRAVRRAIVVSHWPGIRPWRHIAKPGKSYAYM